MYLKVPVACAQASLRVIDTAFGESHASGAMQQLALAYQRSLGRLHEGTLHLDRDNPCSKSTLRAATAMVTSSKVIDAPPCVTPKEFRCSGRGV